MFAQIKINLSHSKGNRNLLFSYSKLLRVTIIPLLLITLIDLNIYQTVTSEIIDHNSSYRNPLIYTRLRFDDNYLQVYSNLQKKNPLEEKVNKIRILNYNETSHDIKLEKQSEKQYYENTDINASDITLEYLILESLKKKIRSRLMEVFFKTYDNASDRKKSVDKKVISTSRCNHELNYLIEKMETLYEARVSKLDPIIIPELLAFFDSYGSEEVGVLLGHHYWIGQPSECTKRRVFELDRRNLTNSVDFNGRYCVASIASPSWHSNNSNAFTNSNSNLNLKLNNNFDSRLYRIQIGICLPRTCDSSLFDTRKEDIKKLIDYKLDEPFLSYNLVDLFCIPDESSELRQFDFSAWLLITFAVLWCSIISIATYFDCDDKEFQDGNIMEKNRHSVYYKLMFAFSLKRNFTRLTSRKHLWVLYKQMARSNNKIIQNQGIKRNSLEINTSYEDGRQSNENNHVDTNILNRKNNRLQKEDLLFLNSLLVIISPLIILAHTGMMNSIVSRYPINSYPFGSDFMGKLFFYLSSSGIYYADWYFAICGFITAYSIFINKSYFSTKTGPKLWLNLIFQRYFKLASIYILTFWFSKSFFKYTGDGPLWDYATNNETFRSNCEKESWLLPITMTSNLFQSYPDECVKPGWYICSEMQFLLITPILASILHKSPTFGRLVSIGLILLSFIFRIEEFKRTPNLLDSMRLGFDYPVRNNFAFSPIYMAPQYRISSYLFGLLGGHYVYMILSARQFSKLYRIVKENLSCFSKFLRQTVWLFGLSLASSMIIGSYYSTELMPKKLNTYARYLLSPLIFGFSWTALGLVMFIAATMFGQSPKFRKFLSHPLWTVFQRINYCSFMIQIELMMYIRQKPERIQEYDFSSLWKLASACSVMIYVIGLFMYLLFESPLTTIYKQFIMIHLDPDLQQKNTSIPLACRREVPGRISNQLKRKDTEVESMQDSMKLGEVKTNPDFDITIERKLVEDVNVKQV